jgi:hypothetical protein
VAEREMDAAKAERVRERLVQCALEAYEDALARGLCAEGAWEVAIGAMRKLELNEANGNPPG